MTLDLRPLIALGACSGPGTALEWLEQSGFATPQEAWGACNRADRMAWYVARVAGGEPGSAARWKLIDCLWATARPEIEPAWLAWEDDPRCPPRDHGLLARVGVAIASRDLAACRAAGLAATAATESAGGPAWAAAGAESATATATATESVTPARAAWAMMAWAAWAAAKVAGASESASWASASVSESASASWAEAWAMTRAAESEATSHARMAAVVRAWYPHPPKLPTTKESPRRP